MRGKILIVTGLAVGYVLGARAGRERYEEIKRAATKFWNDPRVKQQVETVEDFAKDKAPEVVDFISDNAKKVVSQVRSATKKSDSGAASSTKTGAAATGVRKNPGTRSSSTPK
ncbi:MAG TPA: YtxH domain-containing protein [Homoserinimonas sp.]|nr:YtxH domain-containing protein [Homoserinimonas sp.]